MNRTKTKQVKVGNLLMGGNNKVYIQSMTNTKTYQVEETVKQIKRLSDAGCEKFERAKSRANCSKPAIGYMRC